MSSSLVGVAVLWLATVASRAIPGPVAFFTVRAASRDGRSGAAHFVTGAALAELLVASLGILGVTLIPVRWLHSPRTPTVLWGATLASLGLGVIGGLLPAPSQPQSRRRLLPALQGAGLTFVLPSTWNGWATFGLAVVAASIPLWSAWLGILLGLATWAVALALLAPRVRLAETIPSRLMIGLGAALVLAGAAVALIDPAA
jgi:threonine/homoserine/homoserine lactone efflux protein